MPTIYFLENTEVFLTTLGTISNKQVLVSIKLFQKHVYPLNMNIKKFNNATFWLIKAKLKVYSLKVYCIAISA